MGGVAVIPDLANAAVVVRAVDGRKQRNDFLQLPWTLYEGDPNWVPPLVSQQRELLNYKRHAFYEDAEIATFVAYRTRPDTKTDEPVGRIAAIVNNAHNRRFGERRGFFGFFESIDDQAVADALFETARQWLATKDMQSIRGPANPTLNYECGLLVEGFDSPPSFLMTYNKPYYARLIENCGLAKSQDLYAFWGRTEMLATLDPKMSFIADQAAERFNVQVRTIDKSRFLAEVEMFLDIYNRSLVATWGFVPLSAAEMKQMSCGMKRLIVPEMTFVAEVDGQPIGVAFVLPDYNPRIKEINGRLFPFGFIKLLRNRGAIKRVRAISTNVIPEYQRWGISLVLLKALALKILQTEIEEVEFSWVLESNTLSRGSLEKGGAKLTKTYRLYDGDVL